ncbi:hypothetical protein B296_00018656 [Ensete ventricosum]|uniref:Uncharacterized protein n=1 Tax=Ensete ventricosum TaxID=4639 RepID=A0A426XTF3_ENSVE|nr:hypothetical protein B296_00018656 [Ensete ventricosum]
MPPQDRAPIKDVDLESMSMNLKEGGRCVVNRGEGLMTIDFGGHVSLAEKKGAGMAGRGGLARGKHSSMDEAKSISCSVYIALRKKMLVTENCKHADCFELYTSVTYLLP